MRTETFFDNFELLTDAPNAIDELRDVILQLAVCGKLAPQDPSDEPASILLEQVKRERKCLVEQNKIPRARGLDNKISLDEIPYDLPVSWQWVRLADIGHEWGQKKPDVDFTYIDVSTIDKKQGVISDEVNILQPHEAPSRARKIVKEGTVIYSTVRPYLLNIAIVDRQFQPEPIVSTAFAIIHPFTGIDNKYLYYYLRSQPFIEYVQAQMTGMAYPAINDANLFKGLVPLPPLAEQKRIVEKCDRLLSLCDQIEVRQQKRKESIVRMNESAIAQLLSSQNSNEFSQHWQRICNNFDLLYSIPETIPKLRQAILQSAVEGRFKPEKSEHQLAIVPQEKKVSNFVKVLNGYAFKSEWFVKDGIRLLRNANVGHGILRWEDTAKLSQERVLEFQRFKLDEGDIIISLDRPIISTGLKVAKVSKHDLPCLLLQRVGKFEFLTEDVDSDFFFLWLQSPSFINSIDPGRSNGVPHISSKQIEEIPFNPPPLAEQKRIVAKVDRLMSFCDTLEAKLKEARSHSEKLMEVAAKQLLML